MDILYLVFDSVYESPIVESQVVEMCKRINKKYEHVNFTIVSIESKLAHKDKTLPLNIKYIHSKKCKNSLQSYFNFFIKILNIIRINSFDIIHVRSYIPMPIALLIKSFTSSKVIFDMRGLFPEEYIFLNEKSRKSIIYKLLKFSEKIFIKGSDEIIVVSNNFKDYLFNRYKCQCDVIYCSANNYIDEMEIDETKAKEKFLKKYCINKEQIVISYVGSFYKYQNIDQIFKFVAILNKTKKIKFLLFTKNDRKFIENIALNNELSNNEIAIDYVPSNQLTKYLRHCDYGIIYRDNDIINKVSSPIKVSEYIMNNVKIIYKGSIGDFNGLLSKFKYGVDISSAEIEFDLDKHIMRSNNTEDNNLDDLKKLVSYESNLEKYFSIYKKQIE